MLIEGLTDWEKRRLALTLKDRGQPAFLVIKHAAAAVQSIQRGRPLNSADKIHLDLLDALVYELYGYQRYPDRLMYGLPESVDKNQPS